MSICGEVYEFDCVAFNTDLVPVKCAEKENIIVYTNYLSATQQSKILGFLSDRQPYVVSNSSTQKQDLVTQLQVPLNNSIAYLPGLSQCCVCTQLNYLKKSDGKYGPLFNLLTLLKGGQQPDTPIAEDTLDNLPSRIILMLKVSRGSIV